VINENTLFFFDEQKAEGAKRKISQGILWCWILTKA